MRCTISLPVTLRCLLSCRLTAADGSSTKRSGASATTAERLLASAVFSSVDRQSCITYEQTKHDRPITTHNPDTAVLQCITLSDPWEACTALLLACLLQSRLQKLDKLAIVLLHLARQKLLTTAASRWPSRCTLSLGGSRGMRTFQPTNVAGISNTAGAVSAQPAGTAKRSWKCTCRGQPPLASPLRCTSTGSTSGKSCDGRAAHLHQQMRQVHAKRSCYCRS